MEKRGNRMKALSMNRAGAMLEKPGKVFSSSVTLVFFKTVCREAFSLQSHNLVAVRLGEN
jgi:hypothetical protein